MKLRKSPKNKRDQIPHGMGGIRNSDSVGYKNRRARWSRRLNKWVLILMTVLSMCINVCGLVLLVGVTPVFFAVALMVFGGAGVGYRWGKSERWRV